MWFPRKPCLYELSFILNSLLSKHTNIAIDSHAPLLNLIFQLLLELISPLYSSIYIIHRLTLDEVPQLQNTFLCMNTPSFIYFTRCFRNEDLLHAVNRLNHFPEVEALILLNPFKYLKKRKPPYVISLIEKTIERLNDLISGGLTIILYNEHDTNYKFICNKLKYIRHSILITLSLSDVAFISRGI